jgi:hypothetical protein
MPGWVTRTKNPAAVGGNRAGFVLKVTMESRHEGNKAHRKLFRFGPKPHNSQKRKIPRRLSWAGVMMLGFCL